MEPERMNVGQPTNLVWRRSNNQRCRSTFRHFPPLLHAPPDPYRLGKGAVHPLAASYVMCTFVRREHAHEITAGITIYIRVPLATSHSGYDDYYICIKAHKLGSELLLCLPFWIEMRPSYVVRSERARPSFESGLRQLCELKARRCDWSDGSHVAWCFVRDRCGAPLKCSTV